MASKPEFDPRLHLINPPSSSSSPNNENYRGEVKQKPENSKGKSSSFSRTSSIPKTASHGNLSSFYPNTPTSNSGKSEWIDQDFVLSGPTYSSSPSWSRSPRNSNNKNNHGELPLLIRENSDMRRDFELAQRLQDECDAANQLNADAELAKKLEMEEKDRILAERLKKDGSFRVSRSHQDLNEMQRRAEMEENDRRLAQQIKENSLRNFQQRRQRRELPQDLQQQQQNDARRAEMEENDRRLAQQIQENSLRNFQQQQQLRQEQPQDSKQQQQTDKNSDMEMALLMQNLEVMGRGTEFSGTNNEIGEMRRLLQEEQDAAMARQMAESNAPISGAASGGPSSLSSLPPPRVKRRVTVPATPVTAPMPDSRRPSSIMDSTALLLNIQNAGPSSTSTNTTANTRRGNALSTNLFQRRSTAPPQNRNPTTTNNNPNNLIVMKTAPSNWMNGLKNTFFRRKSGADDQVLNATCRVVNTPSPTPPLPAPQLSPQIAPTPTTTPSSFSQKCSVCHQDLSNNFLTALDKKYHLHCFTCMGCHEPIRPDQSFAYQKNDQGEKFPLHRSCHSTLFGMKCSVCFESIPYGDDGSVSYVKHPFFTSEQMCPKHAEDPGRRCTGCHRFEPNGVGFADLGDRDRCVCYACCRTVIVDSADAKPLWDNIMNFFEHHLQLPIWDGIRDIPILIVGSDTLNDSSQNSAHSGSTQILTRGLCLSEHQSGKRIELQRMTFDRSVRSFRNLMNSTDASYDKKYFEVPDAPKRSTPHACVTAILCLSGLPRDLTASVLAHEATHAWIKLHPHFKVSKPIPLKVEEGCCQLVAHLFLTDGLQAMNEEDSSQQQPPQQQQQQEPSDAKLRQYFKFSIEADENDVYGDGFRCAASAYAKIGIEELLNYVVLNREFPKI